MTPGSFFLDSGRVRPIWRFFVSAFLILCANLSVGIALGMLSGVLGWEPRPIMLWMSTLLLLALLGIFKFLTVLENKPLASIGFAFRGRWMAEFGIGLAIGTVMILGVAALEWALGVAHFSLNILGGEGVLLAGAYYLVLFAIAAAGEEITFRGYPFQRLVESFGPAWAVAILSIAFGLVHWGNPSHTWLSTLNTVFIGIPLAVAYLRTRALWLPLGIHFAWNFVLAFGFGLPVSGIQFSRSLLTADVHGLQQLTGGNYGPEGSWLATGVIALATLYVLFAKSIYVTPEMGALASDTQTPPPGNPGPSPELPAASTGERKIISPGVK